MNSFRCKWILKTPVRQRARANESGSERGLGLLAWQKLRQPVPSGTPDTAVFLHKSTKTVAYHRSRRERVESTCLACKTRRKRTWVPESWNPKGWTQRLCSWKRVRRRQAYTGGNAESAACAEKTLHSACESGLQARKGKTRSPTRPRFGTKKSWVPFACRIRLCSVAPSADLTIGKSSGLLCRLVCGSFQFR